VARTPIHRGVIAALAIGLMLSGCARPVGDFGRAEPDVLHDEVMPAIGSYRAARGHEPVSAFNLADEEREMRDRVWRYLIDPHAYDWFGATATELQRTRIRPIDSKPLPKDRYYKWLHGERFASSHVRYARIGADVELDIDTMPSTFEAICAVIELDRQRGIASNGLPQLEEKMRIDAAARQAENISVIAWFVKAVRNRYDSYGYALDHLLVETPHEEAVPVNGGLSTLAIYVEAAERGDFCGGASEGRAHRAMGVRSRVLKSDGALGS
jgi:hypothetical protein